MLIFPANGTAVGLAQSTLIDAATPRYTARTMMTRWTLLSGVGDLLAPIAVGVGVALGMGWAGLCFVAGGLWLAPPLVLASARFPAAHETRETPGLADNATSDDGEREEDDRVILCHATLLPPIPQERASGERRAS